MQKSLGVRLLLGLGSWLWLCQAVPGWAASPASAELDKAAALPAAAADVTAAQKNLKILINAIRYQKDDLAAKQLAFVAMRDALLQNEGKAFTAAERREFSDLLQTLLRKISFSKGRTLFQYLDAVLYGPVSQRNGQLYYKSTIVVHRELKKQEIPLEWVLVKNAGQWQVVDIISHGDSTVAAIRQDQILPLWQEGGAAAILRSMRQKAAEKVP